MRSFDRVQSGLCAGVPTDLRTADGHASFSKSPEHGNKRSHYGKDTYRMHVTSVQNPLTSVVKSGGFEQLSQDAFLTDFAGG
jgi:hypothetical protein